MRDFIPPIHKAQFLMKAYFFFVVVLYICAGGCGSDDETEAYVANIVSITCDGSTITIEFDKRPYGVKVYFTYITGHVPDSKFLVYERKDNLILVPYPQMSGRNFQFSLKWLSGNQNFPDPCP